MSDRLRWVLGFVVLVLIVTGASWWAMAGSRPPAPHAPGARATTAAVVATPGEPDAGAKPATKHPGPAVSMALKLGKNLADCRTKARTGAAAGKPCEVSSDCAEVCCSCKHGKVWFASADCDDGVCQSAAQTCKDALAPNPTICTGPAPARAIP